MEIARRIENIEEIKDKQAGRLSSIERGMREEPEKIAGLLGEVSAVLKDNWENRRMPVEIAALFWNLNNRKQAVIFEKLKGDRREQLESYNKAVTDFEGVTITAEDLRAFSEGTYSGNRESLGILLSALKDMPLQSVADYVSSRLKMEAEKTPDIKIFIDSIETYSNSLKGHQERNDYLYGEIQKDNREIFELVKNRPEIGSQPSTTEKRLRMERDALVLMLKREYFLFNNNAILKKPVGAYFEGKYKQSVETILPDALFELREQKHESSGMRGYVRDAMRGLFYHAEDGKDGDTAPKYIIHELVPDDAVNSPVANAISNQDRAIRARFEQASTIQSAERLGLMGPQQKMARAKVEKEYAHIRLKLMEGLYDFIEEWQEKNQEEEITPERLRTIRDIRDIILFGDEQISENVEKWILKYGLETTRKEPTKEKFDFNVSLGGDQVPPPYVEMYLIEPLQKLRRLKQLQAEGRINSIPTFEVISTMYSQAVENEFDHEGDPINPHLHTYNSTITLARVQDFIRTNFSDVEECVNIHLFPEYKKDGLFRAYLAAITDRSELNSDRFRQVFASRGDLKNEKTGAQDPINKVYPGVEDTYVTRHIFSNLLCGKKNSLRFGADATEPRFHVWANTAARYARSHIQDIMQSLRSALQAAHIDRSLYNDLMFGLNDLQNKIPSDPDDRCIRGHIGMPKIHAAYYKQNFDDEMGAIIENKGELRQFQLPVSIVERRSIEEGQGGKRKKKIDREVPYGNGIAVITRLENDPNTILIEYKPNDILHKSFEFTQARAKSGSLEYLIDAQENGKVEHVLKGEVSVPKLFEVMEAYERTIGGTIGYEKYQEHLERWQGKYLPKGASFREKDGEINPYTVGKELGAKFSSEEETRELLQLFI